jgi:hypothetical protein
MSPKTPPTIHHTAARLTEHSAETREIQSGRPANNPTPAAGFNDEGGLPPHCRGETTADAAWTRKQKTT